MADFNRVKLWLDNTRVDEFVTTEKVEFWPQSISLTRFVYNYMRFLPSEKATCFIKWLSKGEASPQQYEYLAGLLGKSGSPKEANTVLYASREQALAEARKQHNWPRWILMWLQKYTIGYGIGARYFRALLWVIPLTLIGFYVLSIGKANWDFRLLYPSFDNILPVVKLSYNKDDNVIDALNNLPLFVFTVIKVAGYILAIFIAAGFAGLTQKR